MEPFTIMQRGQVPILYALDERDDDRGTFEKGAKANGARVLGVTG